MLTYNFNLTIEPIGRSEYELVQRNEDGSVKNVIGRVGKSVMEGWITDWTLRNHASFSEAVQALIGCSPHFELVEKEND